MSCLKDDYLSKIVFKFPKAHREFNEKFLHLIEVLGQSKDSVLELNITSQSYYPKLYLNFKYERSNVLVDFVFTYGGTISIEIENSTSEYRQNPHSYTHLKLDYVIQKLNANGIEIVRVDHVGFNLPWFSSDLHPQINLLRKNLQTKCLYHKFTTGELWDFILPGDLDEIYNYKRIDYTKARRPKFEVVSFEKDSTPLV